jgi:hypothetical protein
VCFFDGEGQFVERRPAGGKTDIKAEMLAHESLHGTPAWTRFERGIVFVMG